MHRRRMTIWFVLLGVPLFVALGFVMRRAEPHGRGLLLADVPSDVSVAVGDDVLRPCADEYRPLEGCNPALAPGASRRYRWSVVRGAPIAVWAHRAGESAKFDLLPPPEGPTPHLVLDEPSFEWRAPDGTKVDERGDALFVDAEGKVVGPAGRPTQRLE